MKTALNSSAFCAVTADSKSRWPHGKKAYFRGARRCSILALTSGSAYACSRMRTGLLVSSAFALSTWLFVHMSSHVLVRNSAGAVRIGLYPWIVRDFTCAHHLQPVCIPTIGSCVAPIVQLCSTDFASVLTTACACCESLISLMSLQVIAILLADSSEDEAESDSKDSSNEQEVGPILSDCGVERMAASITPEILSPFILKFPFTSDQQFEYIHQLRHLKVLW